MLRQYSLLYSSFPKTLRIYDPEEAPEVDLIQFDFEKIFDSYVFVF